MKTSKKIILNILICIGLLFLISPWKVDADTSVSKQTDGNDFKCYDGNWASDHCWNDYGIEIDPGEYKKVASYTGRYTNYTADREITVTIKNKTVNYGIIIFWGASGTIESGDLIDVKNKKDMDASVIKPKYAAKGLHIKKYTIGKDISDDAKDLYKDGVFKWNLKDEYDALIIVYLKANQSKSCKRASDNKKVEFNCINGKENVIFENGDLKKIGGISASEFVQNGPNQIEIDNLRAPNNIQNNGTADLKKACTNAEKAIYTKEDNTGEEKKDSKYTINKKNYGDNWEEAKNNYISNIYNHVLGGNYCQKSQVAFNLTQKQISELSNDLLETFYESWHASHKQNNSSQKTAEQVEDIAKQKAAEYGLELINADKNPEKLNQSLSCDPKQESKAEKKYIAYKDKKVTANLSFDSNAEVCRTYCYELLTVKYDPPVASIAGICFTYKVTVQTKTECGMTDKSAELLNTTIGKIKKDMCSPAAICSGDSSHTQAGPSEEFDSCIKECDNGEYSQLCINKCYNKVYPKKKNDTKSQETSTKSTTTKTNNKIDASATITSLELINSNKNNETLINIAYKEEKLEEYYKNPPEECRTGKSAVSDKCAKYYFQAKTIKPCGKYVWSKGVIRWKQSTKECDLSKNGTSLYKLIAKAAPFYVRDEASTKALINDIVNCNSSTENCYSIDDEGIKRWSSKNRSSFVCNEKCNFHGCDSNTAITPKQFINGLNSYSLENSNVDDKNDITEIKKALEECKDSAVCEETKTTTFDMVIENPRDSDPDHKVVVDGSNTSGKDSTGSNSTTTTDKSCGSKANNDFSMFVPETGVDKEDSNGILGKCYGKDLDYAQYKTTITFPGSWINYKSRNIRYDTDCSDEYLYKPGLFCSAYDSTNVNANWFKWRTKLTNKDTKQPYEYADPEIKDNIKAYIGYEVDNSGNAKIKNKGFGEFNWHINYSCFYAIWDGADNPPPPDCPDDCCDEHCYQSYKFKVIDQGKLFTKDSKQKQGYNWTSAAKIVAGISANSMTQTYGIDPQKYIEYLNKEEANEVIYNQPTSSDDYYIYIPSEGIDHIKSSYQKQKYTEFNGRFTEDPNIKGLLRYYSTLLDDIKGKDGIKIEAHNNARPSGGQGINNNYSNISQLK